MLGQCRPRTQEPCRVKVTVSHGARLEVWQIQNERGVAVLTLFVLWLTYIWTRTPITPASRPLNPAGLSLGSASGHEWKVVTHGKLRKKEPCKQILDFVRSIVWCKMMIAGVLSSLSNPNSRQEMLSARV
jgi:hypothetical protein